MRIVHKYLPDIILDGKLLPVCLNKHIKITKVKFKRNRKIVTTFYAEIVAMGDRVGLLMPKSCVCECSPDYTLSFISIKDDNIPVFMYSEPDLKIAKGDYFMGKSLMSHMFAYRTNFKNICLVMFTTD